MSLDRLVEEVRARNDAALQAETQRVERERARIGSDRDTRIDQIRSDVGRRATADAARERVQRLASAKLEARKRVFEAREDQAHVALDQTRELLREFTEGDEYPKVLKRMFAYATSELGKDVKVAGRAEDASTLKSVAGKAFTSSPLSIIGGLVAETTDGARRLNLSFDELLRLREDKVREILKV
jgi:vacuolar-type H+-ATPase subunit E/Vma4